MAKPKVLVAGFGPFPGAAKNPSGMLARNLARSRRIAANRMKVAAVVIPTVYREVSAILSRLLQVEKPDIVLMFGLAGDMPWARIEMRAANAVSPVHPDAAGEKPQERTLIAGAPATLAIRAPARRLLAAARMAGVKTKLSIDAGGYICNAAFFQALEAARKTGTPKRVAFVHIPWPRGWGPGKVQKIGAAPPSLKALNRLAEEILRALIADLPRATR
jgi:pyroglutamyl-peptidase